MFKIFKLLIALPVVVVLINLFVPHALSMNGSDPWPGIEQKLEVTPNTFSLHSPISLASQENAISSYGNARSYIAIDTTDGQVILEKNSNEPMSIASLTKIMSAVVALDLVKPDDEITISRDAAFMPPTKIGVVPGEKMTVSELLHAMLMPSANDAAQALMDGVNAKYGQHIFIDAMNEKVRFLGLSETHFANPQGFDSKDNRSSAHDLAVLTEYALSHYPLIATIVQTQYTQLPASALHKQFDLYNWNGLLGVYPGTTGMKIGNTTDAGYTTIVTATREGKSILVVILGAPGILQRDVWASALLDDTFASFGLSPVQVTSSDLLAKYQTWQYWN